MGVVSPYCFTKNGIIYSIELVSTCPQFASKWISDDYQDRVHREHPSAKSQKRRNLDLSRNLDLIDNIIWVCYNRVHYLQVSIAIEVLLNYLS